MRLIRNDVIRILLYCAGCFLLAALITPYIYNGGKALADMTSHKATNGVLDWLGAAAGRAEYPRFFKRTLTLSAVLLLAPLLISLRRSARNRIDDVPWRLDRRSSKLVKITDHSLKKNSSKTLHLVIGFLSAACLLLLAGLAGMLCGWFEWAESVNWPRTLRKSIVPAFFASIAEEIIFRGMLLAIFIRCLRMRPGVVALSAIFAAVHFLIPPSSLMVTDPGSLNSGFRFLGLVASRFAQPSAFLSEFVSLFMVGLLLCYARVSTRSLWLPIGLHAGWVFAFKLFHRATNDVAERPEWTSVFIGDDIRSGLFPFASLMLTGGILHLLLLHKRAAQTTEGLSQ